MSDKTIKLDLSQIGEGGLQEKVDKELEKVIANILDPNTEAKTARKLVITLTMKSDETRQTVATAMEIKSTLAPQKAIATTVLIGQEGSQVYANELKSNMPGQTYFDDKAILRTDVGEPIEDIEDEDDRQVVLEFASALKVENGADIVDNGINQTTTVKSGVASLAKATAPNPVTLRPYRTFTEVEQPSSQFVLRINKEAELALFEADGGKWKLEAIKNIADYLKAGLEDQDNITILA